jgi:hypothetical protein
MFLVIPQQHEKAEKPPTVLACPLVASAELLAKTPDWKSGLRLLGQPVVQARRLLVALEPGTSVDQHITFDAVVVRIFGGDTRFGKRGHKDEATDNTICGNMRSDPACVSHTERTADVVIRVELPDFKSC